MKMQITNYCLVKQIRERILKKGFCKKIVKGEFMPGKNNQFILFNNKVYYGWVIVAIAFICLMFTYGARYAFGVFFKPMSGEFGWSRTMTSGVFSLYMVAYAIGSVITGKIIDKYGPKILIITGAFVLGIGIYACSMVSNIFHLYLFYGALAGLGSSAIGWVNATTTVSRWFMKKRGVATGITSAGIALGSAIFVPLATLMVASLGWRFSYKIIGIAIFLVLTPFGFFTAKSPGDNNLQKDKKFEPKEIKQPFIEKNSLSIEKAIKTTPFWIILISQFFMTFQLNAIMIHFVPYATDIGILPLVAARNVAFLSLTSILGRIFGGWFSDKIGRKKIVAAAMAIQAIALFFLPMIKINIGLFFFILLYGISYGAWVSQSAPFTADIFGSKYFGTLWGTITLGIGIGGAIGPLFAGVIYDLTGGYSLVFAFNMIINILSSILIIFFVKPIIISSKK